MSLYSSWIVFWIVMYTWSTLLVGFRLWVRYQRRLSASDYLAAFCIVLSTIMMAVAIYSGRIAFKEPGTIYHATIDQAAMGLLMFNMTAVILVPLSKCCIILLLLEVEINQHWRRTLMAVLIAILLVGAANVAISFFGCFLVTPSIFWTILRGLIPIAKDQLRQEHCVVRKQWIVVNGTLNVCFEIAIFLCAMSLVARVKSTLAQKAGLVFTFALGLLTMAASIMSAYKSYENYLIESRTYNAVRLAQEFHIGGIWIAVEAYTGLAVASILPIRAILRKSVNRIMKPFTNSIKSSFGGGSSRETSQASTSMGTGHGIMEEKEREARGDDLEECTVDVTLHEKPSV